MRRIAFLIAILGLSILLSLLLREPIEVSSLDGLLPDTVVKIQGSVEEERNFGSGRLLIVDEIPVFCECSGKYVGSRVFIEGVIERFPEDLRIRAFKINLIP
ncbi:MAG: hypothetical protein AABX96_00745 [Nanoarchaeota archaeon]